MAHRNEALSAGISVERLDDVLNRLDELRRYALLNQRSLVDYGRVWRAGERVSTAHIESTVNQLMSHRMCKKRQMRWSRLGAQLLLSRIRPGQARAERMKWLFNKWDQ